MTPDIPDNLRNPRDGRTAPIDGGEAQVAQIAEAARICEARYRLLFDSIDEGFCVIEVLFDPSGKPVDYVVLETNPAFESQTGLAGAIGRRIREIAPAHEEHWFETYGRIALTGEPARFENEASQFGRYYDVYAFRVGEPAERKVAVLFSDITLRKQAEAGRERLWHQLQARNLELEAQAEQIRALNAELEQRVQERTAELEAIFESVPDALYVSDAERIVRANQAALDSYGVESLAELQEKAPNLGARWQVRFADTGQPVPPDNTLLHCALRGEREVREVISRLFDSGQEIVHRTSAAPIVVNGRIVGAVGIATDITAQRQARAKIDYLATLLENVNDAIFAADADLRITAWNKRAEELYGWPAAEAIGAYAPDVLGALLTPDRQDTALREVLETGRWQGETVNTRRDGTVLAVEATAMRLTDETGRVTGFVAVNRDITERKKAEAELRTSREQMQALSHRLVILQETERSYVADQLYNQAGQVLAALQMQLSTLGKDGGRESPAEQLPRMQAMLQQAIGKLHDLARELRPIGLDRSTLARVLAVYAAEFGKANGLAVQFEPGAAETLRVPADVGTALFRSVQEGLSNVARHARASKVVLALTVQDDKLVVTLADNGVGIAAREDSEPRRHGLTTGLGLAGIRERLDIVGGELTILSGNRGTTLTMQAPLAPQPGSEKDGDERILRGRKDG